MAEINPTSRYRPPQGFIGTKHGRLTVMVFQGVRKGKRYWLCRCDCGGEVVAPTTHLKTGNTKSCGCWREEAPSHRAKHGAKDTPEYEAWCHIISRCYNKNVAGFANYGGRGIAVAPEWRQDFIAFLAHVGPRPSSAHSIDRIDVNGHYEPGNVRWATKTQQARNVRANVVLEFRGERRCIVEWAEIVGINPFTIYKRINKHGWTVERALTTPPTPAPRGHNGRYVPTAIGPHK